MATAICLYCDYVGQGETYEERLEDVEEHEKECLQRTTEVMDR
jgi:hypothetical protein